MVAKIDSNNLSAEIQKQLNSYSGNIAKAVNEKLETVAQETAEELKKGGSYKERTGKYSKDWDYKARKNYTPGISTEEFSVYNKKHYQLTHLLEKGHVSRAGKRVKAFEHILPTEQIAEMKVIKAVQQAAEEANSKG